MTTNMKMKTPLLLSYAFRPFFLLNGIFAILIMLLWVMTLHGKGLPAVTPLWHAHEMLIGFALAAVAGFSLTAVANWTRRPAVHGAALGWLVFSWLLGRLAMLLSGSLPPSLIAILDMLFPLTLCLLLGREVISGGSKRNYQLVAILAALVVFNVLYHLGVSQLLVNADRTAIYLIIHSVLLLVIIIAGRIVPNFTANWLRQQGYTRMPINSMGVNRLALILTVLTGLAASLFPAHPVTGILAFAAALVHGLRLSRWQGMATRSNPLLFILHAAYAWVPIGYALMGFGIFGWVFTATSALHALTMGAIGGIILAVTTRVGLGHTGRPLVATRATVAAYWIFMLAAAVRVLGPVIGPVSGKGYMRVLDLAATGWILAFAIFVWVYWPILTRPRN